MARTSLRQRVLLNFIAIIAYLGSLIYMVKGFSARERSLTALLRTLLIHGDGKQRRDFVHINDVVRSYIVAMRSDINGIFNIGGNEALSINDIAELVSKNYRNIFGYTIEVKHIPIDCGVSWKDFTYSSKLAKEMLGYEPAYSINDEIRERFNAHNRTL